MTKFDIASGIMIGHAVGDALGVPLEFTDSKEPEEYVTSYTSGGIHNIPAGYFSDDVSMSLGVADSLLLNNGKLIAESVMRNWLDWFKNGAFSSTGECFDIGMTCQQALQRFEDGVNPEDCGVTGKYASGNGGLMRLHPCVIAAKTEQEAVDNAVYQTRLTHNNPEVLMYSEAFARELWHGTPLPKHDHLRLPKETPRQDVMSGGYVKETYQCAWWCVQNTSSFEEAVVTAVNRGHDADTCAAVTGMLAGRKYGMGGNRGIPDWMIDGLHQSEMILKMANDLMDLRDV